MNAGTALDDWPPVGTKVPCWCGGEARVFERPPAGPLDEAPPSAACPRGHLVMCDTDGRWKDPTVVLAGLVERKIERRKVAQASSRPPEGDQPPAPDSRRLALAILSAPVFRDVLLRAIDTRVAELVRGLAVSEVGRTLTWALRPSRN